MGVSSLFDSCLKTVAKNICLVESFTGFPEIVAEQIFHHVETIGTFSLDAYDESIRALTLFADEYSDQVLCDLNLEGEHLVFANCMEQFMLFSRLRAVNLSSCGLGDEHEFLYHIASLERLQVLSLKNNGFTDEGIRKMTAPVRIKKTGPLNLQALDLSDNKALSVQSLKFLRVFRKLHFLNISCTAIWDVQNPVLLDFAKIMTLTVQTSLTDDIQNRVADLMEVKTRGWAADAIERWIQHSHQALSRARPVSLTRSKAQRFYGRGMKHSTPEVTTPQSSLSKGTPKPFSPMLVLVNSTLFSSYGSVKYVSNVSVVKHADDDALASQECTQPMKRQKVQRDANRRKPNIEVSDSKSVSRNPGHFLAKNKSGINSSVSQNELNLTFGLNTDEFESDRCVSESNSLGKSSKARKDIFVKSVRTKVNKEPSVRSRGMVDAFSSESSGGSCSKKCANFSREGTGKTYSYNAAGLCDEDMMLLNQYGGLCDEDMLLVNQYGYDGNS